METCRDIDVATLDGLHRRALEEVIGQPLAANQRLVIRVLDAAAPPSNGPRPPQTLDAWTHVYDGLSDEEIEAIDHLAKTRANLAHSPSCHGRRQLSSSSL
jgi:hypothetical protein